MRYRGTLLTLFLFGLLASVSAVFAQDSYYVQSAKARVMAAPSFKAAVLGEASRGTKLSFVKREGRWVKVGFYGKEGYVPLLLVTSHPPLTTRGLIKAEDTDFRQSVRRRASTYTSAAAARGLAQDDRRRLGGEEHADFAGLEKVEAFMVTEVEVARFQEGGRP